MERGSRGKFFLAAFAGENKSPRHKGGAAACILASDVREFYQPYVGQAGQGDLSRSRSEPFQSMED